MNRQNLFQKVSTFDKKKTVNKSKEELKNDVKVKEQLVNKIFLILGLTKNFTTQEIESETLTRPSVIRKLYGLQKDLKKVFSSDKLTALQQTALKKQFPGVNLVRQILKELGYHLKPIVRSNGYIGNKKIVKRTYLIVPLKRSLPQ